MDLSKAEKACICPDCPSYFDCSEPMAFCLYAQGKSSCIKTENGCICPGCPVYAADAMKAMYYCTRGSEAAQTAV